MSGSHQYESHGFLLIGVMTHACSTTAKVLVYVSLSKKKELTTRRLNFGCEFVTIVSRIGYKNFQFVSNLSDVWTTTI